MIQSFQQQCYFSITLYTLVRIGLSISGTVCQSVLGYFLASQKNSNIDDLVLSAFPWVHPKRSIVIIKERKDCAKSVSYPVQLLMLNPLGVQARRERVVVAV